MTAKKTARPLKQPAQPGGRTTFEQRTAAMPRLQLVSKPEAEQEPDADADSPAPSAPLTDKDVILRLVEVLKGL